ncbi:hypothetical protein M758_2G153900 [Ceratodon purpureus]|nr:hypothetical protein M758_2G153900 [Ceratodon purpureus]
MSGTVIGSRSTTMASNIWHTFMSLRFSGFKPYLEAGAGWFAQVKEAMKVMVMMCNPLNSNGKTTSPQVRHKIKMASIHMSMEERELWLRGYVLYCMPTWGRVLGRLRVWKPRRKQVEPVSWSLRT